jgi:hypothetical protein
MSVRASTSFAQRTCSGDMYCGVPSGATAWVIDASSDASCFAMPKSSTFTILSPPISARKRFDGLMSR